MAVKRYPSIIVVDDNRGVLSAVTLLLRPYFERVRTLRDPRTIEEEIHGELPSAVLLDMNFSSGINSGNEGLYWLKRIRRIAPDLPVILFTAYADVDLAVRGIKEGASDFVVKPWDNKRLISTVLNSLSPTPDSGGEDGTRGSSMYWGKSNRMVALRDIVEKAADTDANILITGENGTGKEVLANEIHKLSSRRAKEMMTVDMGSIPESLFESELFGHVKGAFTGALATRKGKFEAAEGSTLFLDEIGNLSPYLQSKLLVALQSRRIVRVGDNKPVDVDIRVICATNRDLEMMVSKGEFREDLLYRVNTIRLELPPLRKRREDIIPLAHRFVKEYAGRYGRDITGFSLEAEEQLVAHDWPGNIRELQHVVEKAVIMSDGSILGPDYLAFPKVTAGNRDDRGISTLEDMERAMIVKAVDECGGNMSAVASRLGITRQTLYNKMKRYGL